MRSMADTRFTLRGASAALVALLAAARAQGTIITRTKVPVAVSVSVHRHSDALVNSGTSSRRSGTAVPPPRARIATLRQFRWLIPSHEVVKHVA